MALRLRPYKKCDAQTIVSWLRDEETFMIWGGDRFGDFPITPDTMNEKYFDSNGDCAEPDNFYPMTAFDESGIVGHFIIRYIGGDSRVMRLGWVVVDDKIRSKGYGREMLTLAVRFVFEIMRCEKLTIGVYENNTRAYRCYKSVGFTEAAFQPEAEEGHPRVVELEISRGCSGSH